MSGFYPRADTPPATPPPLTSVRVLWRFLELRKLAHWRGWMLRALLLVFGLVHASPFVHVRVFSLLKIFFGDTRDTSLADVIQATLMLRYNKRVVGVAM